MFRYILIFTVSIIVKIKKEIGKLKKVDKYLVNNTLNI